MDDNGRCTAGECGAAAAAGGTTLSCVVVRGRGLGGSLKHRFSSRAVT